MWDDFEDWMDAAACRGADSNLFFPEAYDGKAAKAICAGCSVRVECLRFAMKTRQRFGIWGGLTHAQRQKLKRKGGFEAWQRSVERSEAERR